MQILLLLNSSWKSCLLLAFNTIMALIKHKRSHLTKLFQINFHGIWVSLVQDLFILSLPKKFTSTTKFSFHCSDNIYFAPWYDVREIVDCRREGENFLVYTGKYFTLAGLLQLKKFKLHNTYCLWICLRNHRVELLNWSLLCSIVKSILCFLIGMCFLY